MCMYRRWKVDGRKRSEGKERVCREKKYMESRKVSERRW